MSHAAVDASGFHKAMAHWSQLHRSSSGSGGGGGMQLHDPKHDPSFMHAPDALLRTRLTMDRAVLPSLHDTEGEDDEGGEGDGRGRGRGRRGLELGTWPGNAMWWLIRKVL